LETYGNDGDHQGYDGSDGKSSYIDNRIKPVFQEFPETGKEMDLRHENDFLTRRLK
jgi:hypothetical protein